MEQNLTTLSLPPTPRSWLVSSLGRHPEFSVKFSPLKLNVESLPLQEQGRNRKELSIGNQILLSQNTWLFRILMCSPTTLYLFMYYILREVMTDKFKFVLLLLVINKICHYLRHQDHFFVEPSFLQMNSYIRYKF